MFARPASIPPFLTCVALFVFAVFASGARSSSLDTVDLTNISQSRTWHYLLGYTDQGKSDISSDAFFLSGQGRENPADELHATLKAFSDPANINAPDQHPQCRFRARYYFLDRQLNLSAYGIIPQPCPGFAAFSYNDEVTGISLVFATGYFGNPASYYGHFLLKLDTDKKSIQELEKTTINFGAIYPPSENMLVYIFKGVFGGYDSVYRQQQYYQQSLNYGEVDLRDVWEYRLNFTREESEFITAHIWELLEVKYQYFFFDRNCAYRMATVLELVLDTKIADTGSLWQIPQHIVQQISSIDHRGEPLVRSINYIPSRQSRLYQRYLNLGEPEKEWLNRLIRNIELVNSDSFDTLPLETKYRLLDTMLDYYQYLITREYMEEDKAQKLYQSVLSKRFRLPAGISEVKFASDAPPHEGRRPSYIQVGALDRDDEGEASVKLRPAYYDSLDYASGHIKNSTLSMAEMDLESVDGDWIVKSIGIVRVENIQRNVTNLPGDNSHSWYLDSGFVNNPDDCDNCMEFEFNGGIGLSGSFASDNLVISGFVGGGIEGEKLSEDVFLATGRILLNINLSPRIRIRMEAKNDYFVKDENGRDAYTIEGRMELTTNSDLRFQIEETEDTELKLAVGFYW